MSKRILSFVFLMQEHTSYFFLSASISNFFMYVSRVDTRPDPLSLTRSVQEDDDDNDNDDGSGGLPAYLRDIERPHRPFRVAEAVPEEEVAALASAANGAVAAGEEDGFAALERHLQLLGQLGLSAGSSTSGAAAGVARRHSVDGQVFDMPISIITC